MSGPNVVILLETADLRATLVDVGAAERPLVVTFDSLTHDPGLERLGFGQGWLDSEGYDAVHVVSRLNAWYQQPEMAELALRVRELSDRRSRTVTYGSSMGGYAAIRFAGRFGAQAAIAISPQFSVDPRRAPFDDRWAEYARDIDFMWEEPDPRDAELRTAWVLYDPRNNDRLHVEALGALYPVTPLPLPHAGHPAGGYLMEVGLLAETVLRMVDGTFEGAGFAAKARALRRRSAHYIAILGRLQPASRPRTAALLAETAALMQPHQAFFLMEHAYWLEARDRLDDAEALLRRAMELVPGHPRFPLALASLLVRTGRNPEEAVELARGVDVTGVEVRKSLVSASQVMFMSGRFGDAARLIRRAQAMFRLRGEDARDAAVLTALVRLGALGWPLLEYARRHRLRREERRRLRRGEPLRAAPPAGR